MHKVIAKLIIRYFLIYSHSIFLENIDYTDLNVTSADCRYYYYWQFKKYITRFIRMTRKIIYIVLPQQKLQEVSIQHIL